MATNYGFKISKAGYDVEDATNDQLIMSSGFNMLKSKPAGTTSGTGDINVAHSLAYIPFCFVIEKISANHYSIIGDTNEAQFEVDSTNLVINADVATDYFRYYIFYHQGY